MDPQICILCFTAPADLITLSTVTIGHVCLQEILTLHFWKFNDDSKMNLICTKCLQKVDEFHRFYLDVQENHTNIKDHLKCNDMFDINIKVEHENRTTEIDIVKQEEVGEEDIVSPSQYYNSMKSSTVNTENVYRNEPIEKGSNNKRKTLKQKKAKRKEMERLKLQVPKMETYADVIDKEKHRNGRDVLEDNLDKLSQFFNMECELCSTTFISLTDAREHYQTEHERAGYLVCCERRFFKYGRIVDHLKSHENPNAFKCTMCDKSFLDGTCLKRHVNELHLKSDGRSYKCDLCDIQFVKRSQFFYHMKSVHQKDDKNYECDKCGQKFALKGSLTAHIKNVHEYGDSRICHICAKYFKYAESYDLHYKLAHSNEIQKVQCDLCGVWLKHKGILKKHMQEQHEKPKVPQVCKDCGKVAQHAKALRAHVKLHHSNISYTCQICMKSFKKSTSLKEHMAIHTGEKALYKCTYCPKTFRSNANMYAHRKRDHPEEYQLSKLSGSKYNNS